MLRFCRSGLGVHGASERAPGRKDAGSSRRDNNVCTVYLAFGCKRGYTQFIQSMTKMESIDDGRGVEISESKRTENRLRSRKSLVGSASKPETRLTKRKREKQMRVEKSNGRLRGAVGRLETGDWRLERMLGTDRCVELGRAKAGGEDPLAEC